MESTSLSGLIMRYESAVPFYSMYVGVLSQLEMELFKGTYISQDRYDIRVDVTSTDSQHF
jgi:hypothetical protein